MNVEVRLLKIFQPKRDNFTLKMEIFVSNKQGELLLYVFMHVD